MNGVEHDELLDGRFFQTLHRGAGKDGVRAAGVDLFGALVRKRLRALDDGPRRIDHVVDHEAFLALDAADDVHDFHDVRLGAAFVDDRHLAVQPLRHLSGAVDRADVGGYDDVFFAAVDLIGKIIVKGGPAEQIVHGDGEKTLDLRRVKVHGEHAVGARRGNEVGDEFCRDGIARARLSVLTRIAEIRHDRRDAPRRGALCRVDHDEKLHQIVVDGRRGGLDDEQVSPADGLGDVHARLAVGEFTDLHVAERRVQLFGDRLCQRTVRVPCKQFDFVSVCDHVPFPLDPLSFLFGQVPAMRRETASIVPSFAV